MLFFILLVIYALDLLFLRMNLKDELRFITHKRVFRHTPKRSIPFFRRFFLLNYVEEFKKQWYWHYIVFLLTAGSGLLALLLHAAVIFFPESYALAQAHFCHVPSLRTVLLYADILPRHAQMAAAEKGRVIYPWKTVWRLRASPPSRSARFSTRP